MKKKKETIVENVDVYEVLQNILKENIERQKQIIKYLDEIINM